MRKTGYALIVIFLISLVPGVIADYRWSNNFYGLVTLAILDKSDLSWNPYSKDFHFVRPRIAGWILLNRSYPYENCEVAILVSCSEAKIPYVANYLGIISESKESQVYEILDHLLKLDYSINEYSSAGLTALQSSILSNEVDLAKYLMSHGADPSQRINREGGFNGMDAIQFNKALYNKRPERRQKMNLLFESVSPNKQRHSGA